MILEVKKSLTSFTKSFQMFSFGTGYSIILSYNWERLWPRQKRTAQIFLVTMRYRRIGLRPKLMLMRIGEGSILNVVILMTATFVRPR